MAAVKKTILVVDDSRSMRADVRKTLEENGYDVVEAENGEEALGAVRGKNDFAMVICDIRMPVATGLDVLEALKTEGRLPALPVVMLTTEAELTLIAQAKQAGARGWLVKPFKPADLVAVARKLAR